MTNVLHVIIGNKKTAQVKWVRYHLEEIDVDAVYPDQHPGSIPEFPELPLKIKNEDLNVAHEDTAAPHRIWMAVRDEKLIPEAIEAMQDAIGRGLDFDMEEITDARARLQKQREAGVEMSQARPLGYGAAE